MKNDRDKTKEQLLAELAELHKKSTEQEQKLKAANQQLDAHNQQLQASEQKLKIQTHKLGERIKELNCLFSISETVRTRETMEEILQDVTEVIPPGWQYPQITCSKITLRDKEYKTENYKNRQWKLSSDIRVNKKIAGKIEVCYLEKKPESDIGPFLNEEKVLLDTIAEQLGHIIEKKETEEALKATNQQLRAANQQLDANNQQLQASEQQLRAANQQLDANNQQLQASEQQLRAANQQLSASEEKYRNLYNNSPDMYVSVSPDDGSILHCNTTLLEKTGYSIDEVIGSPIFKLYHDDCIDNVKTTFQQFVEKGSIKDKELILKRKDGSKIDVSLNVDAIKDESGKILHSVSTWRDITERKQAEEKLKESEERFNLAMNASNDGLFDWDLITNAIYYSPGWKKMIGYEDHELPNDFSVWEKTTAPEDVKKSWELQQKLISKQIDRFVLEFKMKHKDGHWVDILSRAKAIFNDKGKAIRIVGTHTDITERKQAEEKLKESEERFKALHNASFGGIAIHDKGVILECNLGLAQISGFSKNELIGADGVALLIAQESHETVMNNIRSGYEKPYEVFGLRKNGEKYPVRLEARQIPYKGKNVRVVEFRDITEQKRNEQIQGIIHKISNAVITSHSVENFLILVKDELGKLIDTTNFFVALYDEKTDRISMPLHHDEKDRWESSPAGKTMTNYVLKTGKSLLAKKSMIEKLIQSGEVEQVGELSEVWLSVSLKSKNKVTGILAVQSYDNENAYDETDVKMLEIISQQISLSLERLKAEEDLKLAKEKAEESDRLKSAFLTNMSHEIRTPMNGILGFTELLKEPQLTGEEKEKYIQVIEKSGKRMLSTINDIIDISKIEAGQVDIANSEVVVNSLLDEQFNFFQREAKSKELKLNYKPSLPDSESRIYTDPRKLEGILTNLLKNAVKYTETGEITMGYQLKDKADGKFIEFYVSDTGIGVPADRMEAIFNRFEQADIEDTRVFEGSGLGLAISKSYVEMLGGEIGVNSKEGSGSTFTFSIPYNKKSVIENSSRKNSEEEEGVSINNISVIIAEDDETSRIFFSTILKNHVKRITYTTTGKETIEKFREIPDTDIILMDIKMPDMNGYDATREIRKINQDVIIIAQTAYGLAGDKEKALEAGCDDYIAKPIKKELLFEKIRVCLDKKKHLIE